MPEGRSSADTMRWNDVDWLERMYDNRARVPSHPATLARWAQTSAAVRVGADWVLDVRYGDGAQASLDIFRTQSALAPVLFFIHGGYWRSLDKSDQSFIAPPFVAAGVCVVVANLCAVSGYARSAGDHRQHRAPVGAGTLVDGEHISEHGADPTRITVAGHSAGGHLAATLMNEVPGASRSTLALSGLFDLRPLMHTPSLQSALRLSQADAMRLSPALQPAPRSGRLHAVVGGTESQEYLRQNQLIRRAWGADVVPVCEALSGLDHFSMVDALADPAHAVHRLAMQLLQAT